MTDEVYFSVYALNMALSFDSFPYVFPSDFENVSSLSISISPSFRFNEHSQGPVSLKVIVFPFLFAQSWLSLCTVYSLSISVRTSVTRLDYF